VTRRALQIAVPVFLILLAGCSGFAADPLEDGTDREPYGVDEPLHSEDLATQSETDRPADAPAWTPDDWDGGTVDTALLMDNHTEALSDRSFTTASVAQVTDEEGTVVLENQFEQIEDWQAGEVLVTAEVAGEYAHFSQSGTDTAPTAAEYWGSTDAEYTQLEYHNGTTEYDHGYALTGELYTVHIQAMIRAAEDAEITQYQFENTTYHQVNATMTNTGPYTDDSPGSLEFYVHEDGYIVEATLETTLDPGMVADDLASDADELTLEEQYRLTDLDETTVDEPDWLAEAEAAVGEETDDSVDDGHDDFVEDDQPVGESDD